MNAAEWKEKAQTRLRAFAGEVGRWTPGLLYGGLAASTVFPLVEATGQAMATGNFGMLLSLGSLAGSLVGGNLLAEQISRWHDRTEAEIAGELAANAESDPAWQDAVDELLLKFDALGIVQAVLPERDWDRFQRMLQGELAKLGNGEKYASYFINTGGGANIGGGVTMSGGNFAGRDMIINPPASDPAIALAETARQRYLQGIVLVSDMVKWEKP